MAGTSPYDSITFGNPLSLRVDGNFLSTMSIAPNGRDAVLAGRKGLFVIDLDDPFAAPRWLHHETSWEVADVQWSPHKSKPSWVVSTSNQKVMLWNLARPSHDAIEQVLHSHTRAITDINFHPNHPELLATCSVDTFVLSWDLRSPQKPINRWADWRAGASQVKWNYKNPNILASSNDNNLLIWDVRKGAIPLVKITAHDARINGIDWSRENEHEIITCSNDMTVKLWNHKESSTEPKSIIHTDFPVSRARHVPFGNGCCGIMPARGGGNSIYIVKMKDGVKESKMEPSYVFKGHTEPVKDFLWRSRHSPDTMIDDREFQLVTWSADCDLRLWPISDDSYKNFSHVKNAPIAEKLIDFDYTSYRREPIVPTENSLIIRRKKNDKFVTNRGSFTLHNDQFNHLNWIAGVKIGQSVFQQVGNDVNGLGFGNEIQPANLGEEVSNVGHKFPKVRFERISVSTGNLVISLNGPWSSQSKDDLIFIRVEIDFPKLYPSKRGIPRFKIEETHELSDEKRKEIMKNLDEILEKFCCANRFCLEPCLRFLLGEKVNLDFEHEENLNLDAFGMPFEEENLMDTSDDDDGGSKSSVASGQVSAASDSDDDDDDDEIVPEESSHHNIPSFDSTPVPKGCGAVWTPSGHLVCFFIPKEDKKEQQQVIRFGQQGFSLVSGLKRKKIENGLDLAVEGAARSHGDNDSDDGNSSLSSEDSFSNDLDALQYDRLYRTKVPVMLRESEGGTRPLSATGRSGTYGNALSAPTGRSHSTHTSKAKPNKNIVNIYDFRHLIPAKMELAYEYRVLGDSPENLAKYNAEVAERHGYKSIADCWNLLSIILVKDVKIDDQSLGETEIKLLLQSELLSKFASSSKNIDLENNYRFYWGSHPFGGRWLAGEIMKYYERLGDIQMLAMLSCVMHEHGINKEKPTVPINTPYAIPGKSVHRSSSQALHRVGIMSAHQQYNHQSLGVPTFSQSGLQLPNLFELHPHSVSFDRKYSRSIHSVNNSSNPAYANPIPPFTRLASVSTTSSADNLSFKSGSPNDQYAFYTNRRGIKQQSMSYGANIDALYSQQMQTSRSTAVVSPSALSSSSNVFSQAFQKSNKNNPNGLSGGFNPSSNVPVVKVEMFNKEELDLYDDVYSMELLGAMDPDKLTMHRAEYAELLFYWGLPVNRSKILKFNYIEGSADNVYKEHKGEIGWLAGNPKKHNPGTGKQEKEIYTGAEKWGQIQDLKQCHLCELLVTKRLVVCTVCNHLLHAECALEWWEQEKMAECPSGCGCRCLEQKLRELDVQIWGV